MRRKWVVFPVLIAVAALALASPATDLLLSKARSLEGRGRLDLAAQTWQQVLMADPNQTDALAGLARWAKQNGKPEEAKSYLERLRKVAPNHPALAQVESLQAVRQPSGRLEEAERLSRNQQYEQAMAIYREVFGDEPPPGGWAIAYYETESATPGGWDRAIGELRRLAQRYPEVEEYRLSLGRLLTHRPLSRLEGLRILETVQGASVSKARQAWRQALIWESRNPAVLPSMRAYLARYPDSELEKYAAQLAQVKPPAAAPPQQRGLARGKEETLGYEALKAGQAKEAETRFEAVLRVTPRSPGALAGMGFVRMKQEDFGAALEYFEAAKAADPENKLVAESLETARFWKFMKDGTNAFSAGQYKDAEREYRGALTMRPRNVDAMQALGGVLLKRGEAAGAADLYEQTVAQQPQNADAWRALVSARYQASGAAEAISASRRMPPQVSATLAKSLDYLAVMASVYADAGQAAESNRVFQEAMVLARSQGRSLSVPLQVQFAGLFLQHGRAEQAALAYQKVIDADPDNTDAWEGLIAALVQKHEESRAFMLLQRIPKDTYNAALRRVGFLGSVASINLAMGRPETAEAFLRKALEIEKEAGAAPVGTRLRLAGLWLEQGHGDRAERMLRQLLESHPEEAEVWKALIGALTRQHRDREALAIAQRIPLGVMQQLEGDTGYAGLMAAVYNALGQYGEGLRVVRAALAQAEIDQRAVPADLEMQLAWLLLNGQGDERELYALLKRGGARNDLTPAQQRGYLDLWSAWSRRRAETAANAGDMEQAVSILDASQRMLPNDYRIRAALAGMLLKAGDSRRALAYYKSWRLVGATADDYTGAVGAAMAQNEVELAGRWMREGLRKWPRNAQLLSLAGKQAANKGDFTQAEAYWRAALTNLPPEGPAPATRTPAARDSRGDAARSLGRLLMGDAADDDRAAPFGSPAPPAASPAPAPLPRDPRPAGDVRLPEGTVRRIAQRIEPVAAVPNDIFLPDGTSGGIRPAAETPGPYDTMSPTLAAVKLGAAPFVEPNRPRSERQEIRDELNALDARNTPFMSTGGNVQGRSGTVGFERMILQEADLEASSTIGNKLRMSVIARPVYVDAGTPDSLSTLRFGLAPQGASLSAQTAGGLGAETQLSSENFGLRFGSTPQGFLVRNFIGGVRFRPGGGPITFLLNRDSVKDTLLSYAGARDPVSKRIFGGVMANTFSLLGNWGGATSGVYANVSFQMISGESVADNRRVDGSVGSYWRLLARREGSLTAGWNISIMHYDKNLRYFTLGQGGYFSPQQYFLFNVPVRWTGAYRRNLRYVIAGSLGSQHFREDASPYFPTLPALQGRSGPYYPAFASTGANYSLDAKVAYQIAPNWYMGAYLNVNNARNYSSEMAGVYVRYLFQPRPMLTDVFVPSVPDWRGTQPFALQ